MIIEKEQTTILWEKIEKEHEEPASRFLRPKGEKDQMEGERPPAKE